MRRVANGVDPRVANTSKPTAADLLSAASASATAKMRTAEPGLISSYDSATQRATVTLGMAVRVRKPDGSEVHEAPITVPNVPIAWPRAGGYSLTFPLAAGDEVLLVFSGRSLDEWKLGTARAGVEASSPRRFAVQDAVAYPTVAAAAPLPSTALDAAALVLAGALVKLGDSTASDFVALASLVLAELNALRAEIIFHTHATGVGPTGPAIGVGATSNSVAASKVKAK